MQEHTTGHGMKTSNRQSCSSVVSELHTSVTWKNDGIRDNCSLSSTQQKFETQHGKTQLRARLATRNRNAVFLIGFVSAVCISFGIRTVLLLGAPQAASFESLTWPAGLNPTANQPVQSNSERNGQKVCSIPLGAEQLDSGSPQGGAAPWVAP